MTDFNFYGACRILLLQLLLRYLAAFSFDSHAELTELILYCGESFAELGADVIDGSSNAWMNIFRDLLGRGNI